MQLFMLNSGQTPKNNNQKKTDSISEKSTWNINALAECFKIYFYKHTQKDSFRFHTKSSSRIIKISCAFNISDMGINSQQRLEH